LDRNVGCNEAHIFAATEKKLQIIKFEDERKHTCNFKEVKKRYWQLSLKADAASFFSFKHF